MSDRRRLKRKHLIYYLKAHDAETNQLIGRVQDLHIEGLMLTSETPLQTPAIFHLSIELPGEIMGKERLDFQARSVWRKQDLNPDYHDTGFQLQNVSDEDTKVIKCLTRRYRFRE